MNKIKDLVKKNKTLIRQFILYGVIGGLSALTDFFVFKALIDHLNLFISNLISVNIGITISFILNTFINFKAKGKLFFRALSFFSIGYIGLAISTLLLYIGVTLIGFSEIPVKIFTIFAVACIQFVLNKLITFKDVES